MLLPRMSVPVRVAVDVDAAGAADLVLGDDGAGRVVELDPDAGGEFPVHRVRKRSPAMQWPVSVPRVSQLPSMIGADLVDAHAVPASRAELVARDERRRRAPIEVVHVDGQGSAA